VRPSNWKPTVEEVAAFKAVTASGDLREVRLTSLDGRPADGLLGATRKPRTPLAATLTPPLWPAAPPPKVLCTFKQFELTRKDFNTLREGVWLNDEVINCYMALAQVGGL
jgi:hypothetical protein